MISTSEIESIVRRVLTRMLADASHSPTVNHTSPVDASTIHIPHHLITLQSLPRNLEGVRKINIPLRAVITPAARDRIQQAKAIVVRELKHDSSVDCSPTVHSSVNRSSIPVKSQAPIVVTGSVAYLPTLRKMIASSDANVLDPAVDDAAALRDAATALRNEHRGAVVIVRSAHAVAWQAARDEKLRPVAIGQWKDLENALAEVPANLIVLSSKYWTAPAAGNVVRTFKKHLDRS